MCNIFEGDERLMKKLLLIIIIGIVTFILFGCNHKSNKLNNENVDNVSIFYGFSSYAMFSEDDDTLRDLLNQFSNLSFEPTDQKMDIATMLHVNFYHNEKIIASFKVDENGVFWLDGETNCYKVSSGSFDYEIVKNIYLRSK